MDGGSRAHLCYSSPAASFSLFAVMERPTDGAVLSAASGGRKKKKKEKRAAEAAGWDVAGRPGEN